MNGRDLHETMQLYQRSKAHVFELHKRLRYEAHSTAYDRSGLSIQWLADCVHEHNRNGRGSVCTFRVTPLSWSHQTLAGTFRSRNLPTRWGPRPLHSRVTVSH